MEEENGASREKQSKNATAKEDLGWVRLEAPATPTAAAAVKRTRHEERGRDEGK